MYIKVKVVTKAREETFTHIGENRFEIRVKEKAERNMANTRVCELVAQYYDISSREVKIVSGHHHPSKLLAIPDK